MVFEKRFILLGGEITAEEKHQHDEIFVDYTPRNGFLKFVQIEKDNKMHVLEEKFFKEPVK